jgi:HAE1 family hydrophobic/amphiphilic exporter-1
LITTVGQQSTGFGGAQATTYQSEVQVNLTDKSERSESTNIKAAKIKRQLEENSQELNLKQLQLVSWVRKMRRSKW